MKTPRAFGTGFLASLFLVLCPLAVEATLIVQRITGAPAGQFEAEASFLDILNDGAGVGVGYQLNAHPVLPAAWTVQRNEQAGAVQSTFDTVLNEALTNPVDLFAEVGYGSQGGALFSGILVDAFMDNGPGTPGTGKQRFDIQDLLLFPRFSPDLSWQTTLLLHGIYELHHSVAGITAYEPAHTAALAHENAMSASVGGPERFEPALPRILGPSPAWNLLAGEWLIEILMDPFGPAPLGFMQLRGFGDPGNLVLVRNGPFDFPSDYYLPATSDGDIVLESVSFVRVSEPAPLGLVALALVVLLVSRFRSSAA